MNTEQFWWGLAGGHRENVARCRCSRVRCSLDSSRGKTDWDIGMPETFLLTWIFYYHCTPIISYKVGTDDFWIMMGLDTQ